MRSEHSGHKTASAGHSCHLVKRQEQQQRARNMKHQICGVQNGGMQPEELNIQHVRQPRQGMPVVHGPGAKSPRDPLPGEASPDVGIIEVTGIIVIYEIKSPYSGINEKVYCDQAQAEPDDVAVLRCRDGSSLYWRRDRGSVAIAPNLVPW